MSSSSSRPKRKMAQLGEHTLSAAVGDVVARTMSAAVGRYNAHASVDDQLERLDMLLIMVHSAVEAAEGVHIRSWWLRHWLWRLRDAALDGDEVLRSMRQQRRAEAAAAVATQRQSSQGPGGRLWSAATRVARSAKSLLVSASGGDDGGVDRLGRTVARLEKAYDGLGDFLKLLELEIMRSRTPAPPPPPASSTRGCGHGHDDDQVESKSVSIAGSQPDTSLDDDGSESEHGLAYFSHEYISQAEYIGCSVAIGLQIVTRKIQRAAAKLRMPPAPAPAPEPDTDTGDSQAPEPDTGRLRRMVDDIREAVGLGDRAEVNAERWWLAEWRRELHAVADRADRALLAPAPVGGGGEGDDEVRRTVRSLETAAAHLRAYLTLLRFAVVVVESR